MPDTKITALTAIGANPIIPSTFPIPMVDLTDTSMAASGTTKKVTVNQILGAGGTATLASATITGALTAQGTQVKLSNQAAADCTVLIGPDTPSSTRSGRIGFITSSTEKNWFIANNWNVPGGFEITQSTAAGGSTMSSNPTFRINNNSDFLFLDGAGGTRMTLNSTGLGVGGSPVNFPNYTTIHAIGKTTTAGGVFQTSTSNNSTAARFACSSTGVDLFVETNHPLAFYTNATEKMRIDSSGNVGIGVTPAGTGGCLQLKSGITFPATQVASSDANTLDDYEEGTWTIGLTFGGGSTGITTSANTGRYTKVGRQVTVIGYLSLTNKGSSTGSASITGLPFAIPNIGEAFCAASLRIDNLSYVGSPQALGLIGNTKIELEQVSEAGTATALTNSNFSNSTGIIFTLTYTV